MKSIIEKIKEVLLLIFFILFILGTIYTLFNLGKASNDNDKFFWCGENPTECVKFTDKDGQEKICTRYECPDLFSR